MSDEPIDLNSWLNEAPLSPVEQGAADAVSSVTTADIAQAQDALDAGAQEVGTDDLLATFPAALSAPVENGTADADLEPLPDFESVAQPAPEMSREEKLKALDARDDRLNALGEKPRSPEMTDSLRDDVRAVGDRVTLVFESLNRLETDVAAFGSMFRALLKALEVDESELPEVPPAEAKRTRRKKSAE